MTSDEKVCPRCAETIKAAATVCRFCNYEFRPANLTASPPPLPASAPPAIKPMAYSDAPKPAKIKTWVWVVGAIVGGLILLGLIGSIGGQPPGNAPSEAGAPEAPSTPQAGTVAISAENLAAAFDANLIAAQKTYGGKVLDVTGTISEITTDFSNDPVLELEGSNLFLPVRAHFEANYADKFSTLSKGSQITVRCSSLATMLSTPTLDNCSLP